MKSLLRISLDENDNYILEYRIRYGYYAGKITKYSFTSFSSMLTHLLSYLFSLKTE